MKQFTHLHVHSHYSLMDAVSHIDTLVSTAYNDKMEAIGLTDHGTLAGTIAFYNTCKEYGIKPIIGSEMYIARRHRTQKENKYLDDYYHILLLAIDKTGWSNLCRLVTESYKKDNFYYKPRIDRELLYKYNEGLICLSGCIGSNLPRAILKEHNLLEPNEYVADETPEEVVEWYKKIFGDRYYLEIQRHNLPYEHIVNNRILELADKYKLKVVATTDAHYVVREDKLIHNIILTLGMKRDGQHVDITAREYEGDYLWLINQAEANNIYQDIPWVLDTSMEIAERCKLNFEFGGFKLPKIVEPEMEDQILIQKVYDGLREKFGDQPPKQIIERVEYELKIIIQMSFASYFLIVSDYCVSQKSMGRLIGPGRGSAAGSLVSYLLGITDINPLDYGLSFARFLNKGRCAMPKIDFPEYSILQWKQNKEKQYG